MTSATLTRSSTSGESIARLRGHLALAPVGQQPRRLVQWQPARLGHLDPHRLLDLAEPSPAGAEEVEADDLEDAGAVAPRIRVLDVAELLHEAAMDAGLLEHLADCGLGGRLARVEVALRERPGALRLALR